MKTAHGHLTYCTNIHKGEDWATHFRELQEHFPIIKAGISPDASMGLGLRLSNKASQDLQNEALLQEFKSWLHEHGAYVFTINGFPYGEFHNREVKDQVHHPDWTTEARYQYTKRIFTLLATLAPKESNPGISTSPLSYRHWFPSKEALAQATQQATHRIVDLLLDLIALEKKTGVSMHLDIEPEPDGILETGREFIDWYLETLIPLAQKRLHKELDYSKEEAEKAIRTHIQLCYDVCHFALGYEDHQGVIEELDKKGIKTGKIQISAALKAEIPEDPEEKKTIFNEFSRYNEPVYLHQVIAQTEKGTLNRYRDLPDAFQSHSLEKETEWRAHFHVPIFQEKLSCLKVTQSDIKTVLGLHKNTPFSNHLEVETYTWEVLPDPLKLPIAASILRELQWVIDELT